MTEQFAKSIPAAAPMIFVDLRRQACSWDIVSHVAAGLLDLDSETATVAFVQSGRSDGFKKMPHMTRSERSIIYENVMLPVCRMFGCGYFEISDRRVIPGLISGAGGCYPAGYDPRRPRYVYQSAPLVDAWHRKRRLPRMAPSPRNSDAIARKFGSGFVTITLRQSPYFVERNIDPAAWAMFARSIASKHRVVVVPDGFDPRPVAGFEVDFCCAAATDADLRLALYEAAALNVGSDNGPLVMAIYSTHIPYLVFQHELAVLSAGRSGIARGEQYPWVSGRQRIIRGVPGVDGLIAAFNEVLGA